MRGNCAGSASMPRSRAIVSAVLMLVSDAPSLGGRYVVLVRIGFMGAFIHVVGVQISSWSMSSRHSVAVAVMIGVASLPEGL